MGKVGFMRIQAFKNIFRQLFFPEEVFVETLQDDTLIETLMKNLAAQYNQEITALEQEIFTELVSAFRDQPGQNGALYSNQEYSEARRQFRFRFAGMIYFIKASQLVTSQTLYFDTYREKRAGFRLLKEMIPSLRFVIKDVRDNRQELLFPFKPRNLFHFLDLKRNYVQRFGELHN